MEQPASITITSTPPQVTTTQVTTQHHYSTGQATTATGSGQQVRSPGSPHRQIAMSRGSTPSPGPVNRYTSILFTYQSFTLTKLT